MTLMMAVLTLRWPKRLSARCVGLSGCLLAALAKAAACSLLWMDPAARQDYDHACHCHCPNAVLRQHLFQSHHRVTSTLLPACCLAIPLHCLLAASTVACSASCLAEPGCCVQLVVCFGVALVTKADVSVNPLGLFYAACGVLVTFFYQIVSGCDRPHATMAVDVDRLLCSL